MPVPGAVPVHLNVLSSASSEFLFNITFPEGSFNLNKLGFIHKRNEQCPPTCRFCLRETEEQKAERFETQPFPVIPFAAGRYKICFTVLAKTSPRSSERSLLSLQPTKPPTSRSKTRCKRTSQTVKAYSVRSELSALSATVPSQLLPPHAEARFPRAGKRDARGKLWRPVPCAPRSRRPRSEQPAGLRGSGVRRLLGRCREGRARSAGVALPAAAPL